MVKGIRAPPGHSSPFDLAIPLAEKLCLCGSSLHQSSFPQFLLLSPAPVNNGSYLHTAIQSYEGVPTVISLKKAVLAPLSCLYPPGRHRGRRSVPDTLGVVIVKQCREGCSLLEDFTLCREYIPSRVQSKYFLRATAF